MIIDKIRALVTPDTVIPKPKARDEFIVKGWGTRRSEEALIYRIPNRKDPQRPYEKGITVSEFKTAYDQLVTTGRFTKKWFDVNLPGCAKEGSCNFTTIGGILGLVQEASYSRPGVYVAKK